MGLYNTGLMFHGPCFQGVAGVDVSGENGVIARLQTLPANTLFRSLGNPQFVTDPVVLDAAGQLVGFWAAEYLERGFVVFPYHLTHLAVYGPNRQPGEALTTLVDLKLTPGDTMRSNIDICNPDGSVWMQLEGWADRRFDPPRRFHQAWIAPRSAMLSESWTTPLAGLPASSEFDCFRVESMFPPGAGLWKDLWASLVLSRRERQSFEQGRGPEHRHMEWLAGRTAVKDAVRSWLRKHYGLELLAADVEIEQDEHGKPRVAGLWTTQVPAAPEISLTHSDGMAVALVCDPADGQQIGIDLQRVRDVKEDFLKLAFGPDEERLISSLPSSARAEWIMRLWCAKEAVSKALGRGLVEGPKSVEILSFDSATGVARATPKGKLAEAVPDAADRDILAYTVCEEAHVVAIAVFEKRAL